MKLGFPSIQTGKTSFLTTIYLPGAATIFGLRALKAFDISRAKAVFENS